jgi:hypothetical protein
MSKILLWVFSIFFIVMSLGFVTISFIASILFLIAGAYLNPIVRSKFLARLENSPLLGKKVGFAFVSILLAIGVFKVFDDENTASVKKAVVSYQSNPADFILKINKNAEDKKFYLSIAELDRIIPSIPNDQVLKNLRHEITIAEIKFNASEEKLYRFDDKNLAKYKEIMGATSNENDIFKTYTDLASSYIAKEETSKAKEVIKNLVKISPNNKAIGELTQQITTIDQKLTIMSNKRNELAVLEKKKASGPSDIDDLLLPKNWPFWGSDGRKYYKNFVDIDKDSASFWPSLGYYAKYQVWWSEDGTINRMYGQPIQFKSHKEIRERMAELCGIDVDQIEYIEGGGFTNAEFSGKYADCTYGFENNSRTVEVTFSRK